MIESSVVGALHDRRPSALQHAREYLLERQSPGGGFCFYRGYYIEEPNLSDTWHGVAALTNLLGVELTQRKIHASFVIGHAVEPQPSTLYYRIRSLQVLQSGDPAAAEVERAVTALRPSLPDPARPNLLGVATQRLHRVLWLRKYLNMDTATKNLAESVRALVNEDGGYGTPSNLLDTAYVIALLTFCGVTAPGATRGFVASMDDPHFGFRATATSRSPNLETVHAGAASCRHLGLDITYFAAARSFVLSCQTGSGGFARASGALPDMTLTYMALTTLIRDLREKPNFSNNPSHSGTG